MKPKSYLRIPLWWPSLPKNWRGWLPSRGNVVFTLVIAGLLILGQSVGALPLGVPSSAPAAASTGTIAYQGRLADAAGTPVTDSINMTFRLYDAAGGGIPLWQEPWDGPNAVQVSDGLFNVMLGSLQQLPQAVIAGRDQLFLGITVGTDNEMAPRVQLGSVPFAVQALTVPDGSVTTAKVADEAITQSKLATDVSVVPPDGSITTVKIANGAVTSAKLNIGDLNVKGTGVFGTPNAHALEGGEIQIAEVIGGPRWHFDNYNSGLRWFNCQNASCVMAMTLDRSGNFGAAGTKSAIVRTDHYGQRKLYAVEAPDVRFSDEGLAHLQDGVARVELDPIFLETIEGDYLVHVTPYGDAALYVAEVGQGYFVVRSRDGDAKAAFAWRLSAMRKGYADVRLEEVK